MYIGVKIIVLFKKKKNQEVSTLIHSVAIHNSMQNLYKYCKELGSDAEQLVCIFFAYTVQCWLDAKKGINWILKTMLSQKY